MIKICNRIIEYSFYGIFLLVPLVLSAATSELFELNKMWLTWALTIAIGTAWFTKMILQRRILFQRTPLDIPIALFLTSQIISTIFSLDFHVSLWGYYSRFNGGLLSILSYIFLYYAFVTYVREGVAKEEGIPTARNDREHWREGLLLTGPRFVKRVLFLSLISGLIVALWGLPSHFGYDPTCFLFRGTLDVSCWTADFMPKIRIFSTLGQPDWLAAYLAILIPIAIAKAIQVIRDKGQETRKNRLLVTCCLLLVTLFYVDLLFTRARSGVLGIWIALIFFSVAYFIGIRDKKQEIIKNLLLIPCLFLLITFVIGTPIDQLRRFTLEGIGSIFQKPAITETQKRIETQNDAKSPESGGPARRSSAMQNEGGTESGDIRLNVWKGAINAWRANPIIGSGVETFAFAYYKYKPVEHNLTSEWNFLYNKAHNEYLNYLATTGIFGLGSYLLMIGWFFFRVIPNSKGVILNSFQDPKRTEIPKQVRNDNKQVQHDNIISLALLASYISILITNFFGFSVVIINIYLFMIPAFVFVLMGKIKIETSDKKPASARGEQEISKISPFNLAGIFFILVACFFLLVTLFRFWRADIAYALGYNLDRAGEYQQAYPHLHKAMQLRGDELVFKDELSINDAVIAAGLIASKPTDAQKEQTISVATSLVQEAINTSNEIISKSPNNAVFWKTRVRLFYTLSQVDAIYLPKALEGIEKASLLAPNDANIWYNLGVLYGQNDNIKKGIEALEKTVKLKPNYRDAHYALGLYYHTASLDETGKVVIDPTLNQKALAQMQYILDHIARNDAGAQESIKNWEK